MLRSRLLALTFSICLLGNAVSANAQVRPPGGRNRLRRPVSLLAGKHSAAAASAAVGRGTHAAPDRFRDRVCATSFDRRPAAQRREGRSYCPSTVLWELRNEPVWITPTGFSAAARAVHAEIGRADDWGLEASAYRLPALVQGAELTREQLADAEIALSLAVLEYARHARGGRTDPLSLSRNLDRKPQLLDPRSVIETAAFTDNPDAYLRALHPQHPQFERLRQAYLSLKRKRSSAAVEQVVQTKGKGKSKKKQQLRQGSGRPQSAHAARQHGAVALDARGPGQLLCLGQHPRVHGPRRQGRPRHSQRARRRRPGQTQTPVFSHADGAGDLPPLLGRAGIHQDERAAAEPGARQHRRAGAPEPARLLSRPRHQSRHRRLDQGGHAQIPRLSAAGQRQRAGHREIPLPQQARRLHARHAEQEPVQRQPRARSVTAACACAIR